MIKNRFNMLHRPMDWPELLKDINNSGVTYKEIGEICGLSGATISNVANDLKPNPKEWDAAFVLIDLWIRLDNRNLPTK